MSNPFGLFDPDDPFDLFLEPYHPFCDPMDARYYHG
jgi:hypothetical protein